MEEKKVKKLFILNIIMMTFSSIISVYAASYLFESEQVSYDNTSSGLTSTNVQDSLDELYNHATDYTEIKSYFKNNPTSYFLGTDLEINKNGTRGGFVDFWHNGKNRAGVGVSHDDGTLQVISKSESGDWGQSKLEIIGKPININATNGGNGDINLSGNVKINNTNINDYFKTTSTQFSTTLKKQLNAHSGDTFTNLLTNQPSVSVPSGYTLVSHVYIEISGISLVNCIFDSMSNTTKTSNINGYIYNSGTGNVPSGNQIRVNIVSLWRKS